MKFALRVTWLDGSDEYLNEGERVASFSSRTRADEQRSFMLEGIADEVQGISVVPYPAHAGSVVVGGPSSDTVYGPKVARG